jgi:NAD(P)H-hydrate repair Nnr-like enzyme with NAD(P)H-hydrate dehydratase domain
MSSFCILLRLNVLKVDRTLHMGCAWKAVGGTGDVQGDAGTLLARSLARPMLWLPGSLSGCSPTLAPWIRCPDSSKSHNRIVPINDLATSARTVPSN